MIGAGGGRGLFGIAWLPILLDAAQGDGFTLSLGLKPGIIFITGDLPAKESPVAEDAFLLGGSVLAKVLITEGIWLIPEFDIAGAFGEGTILAAAMMGIGLEL